MANEEQAQGQPQPVIMAPPTHAVTHFGIAMSVSELMIALGQSRVSMGMRDGLTVPTPLQEWFLTLSVPPSAAKQLHLALTSALDAYEKAFGKIPTDPKMKIGVPTPAVSDAKPK